MMLPEGNNVYGILTAHQGMRPVLQAVQRIVTDGRAYIDRSNFNGVETLHLQSKSAEFESDRLENGIEYLFNGGVGGSLEEVVGFVRTLSEALSRSGVEHSFEVYHDDELVQRIPECSQ